MNRRPGRLLSFLAIALSTLTGFAAGAQPDARLLWIDPDRFTSARNCGEGLIIEGADITSVRNAPGLDGAIHFAGLYSLDFAVHTANDAHGIFVAGGRVHAPSGRVSLTAIDLSFPCAGPSWTIGRSYASGVQTAGGARVSPGYQGNNWFASAQPLLVPCLDESEQVAKLTLVFGADRVIQFTRITSGAAAGVFRATNGAAGAIHRVVDNGTEYYDYHDASGNVARFMGATGTASAPSWHLLSITDAAGASASIQYAAGLPSVATDSANRTFTYTYTSGGTPLLASVVVQATGGVEVGRVEYTYAGTSDPRGLPGDLIAATTRTPVSDQSHTIDRTWHYRYYTDSANAGRLLSKIEPEGVKRAQEDQLDPSLVPAAYRDCQFGYDASGRVASASVREMPRATLHMSYAQRTNATGYDPTWHFATIVHTQTEECEDLWQSLYYDQAEQFLGAFAFDADPTDGTHIGETGQGAKILAASWQERNADGIVTRLHDGANLSQYVHLAQDGNVFVASPTFGLVVDRELVASGLYAGFEAAVSRRAGVNGASTLISSTTYFDVTDGTGAEAVGGYLVASPLTQCATRYPTAGSAGEATTNSYTFHSGHGLSIKTLTTTDPVVTAANNGDGSTNSVSQYFALDGRQRFERTRSGRIHVWEYDPDTGQLTRFVWDAAASQVSGTLPDGFAVTGPANELMRRVWSYTYDPQGRIATATSPDGRVALSRVDTFADGRPLVYSVPRVDGLATEDASYFGPVSFTKLDLEGGVLESVDIGPKLERAPTSSGFAVALTTARTSTDPRSWIGANAISLLESVATGFERANLITRSYDKTATFQEQTRVYTKLAEVAPSPEPLIAREVSTLPYDLTRYGYDCAGRSRWTRKPDGTVYTAMRDPLGRTTQVWRGFADGQQDPATPTQQYQIASLEYDQGAYALLNRLTTLTLLPGAGESIRVTQLYYDIQGDVVAVKSPVAPHAVYRRDQLGRVNRRSLFGGDGAFLDAANFDPAVDRVTDRQRVDDTFYDPMGRVYRSTRYAINPDGSSDSTRTSPTDYFFGKEGRVRLISGDTVTEFGYNRGCELCRIRQLAQKANAQTHLSVQNFLNSAIVLEDTRLLRDRSSGRVTGRIVAARDVGLGPYDAERCSPGDAGPLIQDTSITWNDDADEFSFAPPQICFSSRCFNYHIESSTYSYDALGRLATTVNVGDPRINNDASPITGGGTSEIAAAAQALALIQGLDTDDAPRASIIAYDGLGRQVATVGPDGGSRTFQYDALSRAVSELGGSLADESTPGSNGPNGPEVGMLVINFCPREGGEERGFDRGKLIWGRAIIPGDPNYPDSLRTPEEHWFFGEDNPATYPVGIVPIPPANDLPPSPREPALYHALVDQVPSAWQDLELLTTDFREATGFTYNALGQPISIASTGGAGFQIQRDAGGRPIEMSPVLDSSVNALAPTPALDVTGSLTTRWEYDSLGRLHRVYQHSSSTNAPVLDTLNSFGSLGELLSQTTTDHANPDPAWSGIAPMPTSQVRHIYQFGSPYQTDSLQRLQLIGTDFPGGLGMKIDFESCPIDERIGRPRRAIYGTWTNDSFAPPSSAGQPIDSQFWRGAYHGIYFPAWDELARHPFLDDAATIRDRGPALGMALIPGFGDPGYNRFGELTRDWIHQPVCNGISCDYPGTSANPLSTPFGNDDTITRGRDGTSRTTTSDTPTSRDLTYQPINCNTDQPAQQLLGSDIFQGPVGTLVVRRGDSAAPTADDPVRVEHLVRDASGGLLKHVIEQDIGAGREVLSVYEAVFSSSNRLVAYATKTPPDQNTHWDEMPSPLSPTADESIIVRPEYDLRGNLVQDRDNTGRLRRFSYDAQNRLTAVYTDLGESFSSEHTPDWRVLARYRYDALGRRVASISNRGDMSTLDDDFVEFYGYDQSWRLTTVWRQGAKQTSGPISGQRPQPVIYERFLHNPGWGSKLDAPLMSQVNDHWDDLDTNGGLIAPIWQGEGAHIRTFIQDSLGNVIAVRDNTLQRDTVRISYSPTGEPILDSYYSGADFNRDGGIDGVDLSTFTAAYEQGDETADLDQNGGIDGVDLALFFDWYEAGFMGDHTLNDQRFLYRGYAWDDTLKMYHVRHRVYDPARMLWIQRDPLGRIPGSNEYAYCLGEPVDSYDPMGLEGDGLDDIRDQVKRVPGDPDANMGATPAQRQMQQDEASRADRVFDALGSALISMIPVVGDLAEIREINRDPNRSTLNKAVNTTGIILIGFVPPAKVVKVGGKLIKTADKIDDLADAAKTLDRVSDAADAAKDGERAKDAAKAADKVADVGDCGKKYKNFTRNNFRENLETSLGRKLDKDEQAHHIVAQDAAGADEARDKLKELGIDVHDPSLNGMALHNDVHSGLHTEKYYEYVNKQLRKTETREQAADVLDKVRKDIESGTRPWEKMP